MSQFSAVIIGNESLAIQCAQMLQADGHDLKAVITRNPDIADWARKAGVIVHDADTDIAAALSGLEFDWLLSIANLDMIPDVVLAQPARGAVNFHDGPLPRYAGLNAPAWALINNEVEYGISWHVIAGGVDEGPLVAQQFFDIAPDETTLTLNAKCYAAAIDSFAAVVDKLSQPDPVLTPQDLTQRSYFARNDRPAAAGRIDFSGTARKITTLVRALDHGSYWNPMTCPKIMARGKVWLVSRATAGHAKTDSSAGTVLAVDSDSITIATTTAPVTLSGLMDASGTPVSPDRIAATGDQLDLLDTAQAEQLAATLRGTLKSEPIWRKRLEQMVPANLPLIDRSAATGHRADIALAGDPAHLQRAFAALAQGLNGGADVTLAVQLSDDDTGYLHPWGPVSAARLDDDLATAQALGPFAADLLARIPTLPDTNAPALGLSFNGPIDGVALTLAGNTLFADTGKISPAAHSLMADRLVHMAADIAAGKTPTLLAPTERQKMIYDWNATGTSIPADPCIHHAFEAQAARTPDAMALAFEAESLSYAQLNTRANEMAHILRDMGVGPDTVVGLHLHRSSALVIAALAILKAGGAYLPMDPTYPAERTAFFIADSETRFIVTDSNLASALPDTTAQILLVDALPAAPASDNPATAVSGDHLAYLIYTSGSTGRPKGVMVEHRNVANFFAGMDARISHDPPGVWMAVTSLSFDISVLELFWTLARGFKVVISSDENRALVAGDTSMRQGDGMDFSLYYWGNDDGVGRDKYRTLLEGAQFADRNGFCAVWTPERHFHAFGGPYPNPSVTGAAVAAVTHNLAVRAGSCVAPLHHTARIAEEWAVIDNLTNGRSGLAIASGWQPDDFILRPENTPPRNKPAMFEQIRDLRKLWAGETVAFPRENGDLHPVVTQPRPVSKKLNVWVTTAGNPATWQEAGENGCNVLTHLLGQSVQEVGEKIAIYHSALRKAGHNPDDFTVTLMLHSFLAESRDQAREIARGPMKDYLRAAAGLIKSYAWAFPAFKKPKGVENPTQIDLGSLDEEELEGILDFAFERYFNDSGLFGTVEDALARVEQVKAIGVTEIACLIDYGIDVDHVMAGLEPLADVVRRMNPDQSPADDDYSIAAQIMRHKVTHLQCTPSMAQMLTMNDEARIALKQIDHIMVGGEALPGALADELLALTGGHVENMYGPTETTIWSTTQTVTAGQGAVPIGSPVANTQVYVLDDALQPVPVGFPGTLYIGGAGVTRGYFNRPDLTQDRFVPDPFVQADAYGGGRMYNTGDLARWRADGTLDFLGRADFQVKLRGYRVELGEIEAVIDRFADVQQSVVVAREDTPGVVQLVAYLLTDARIDQTALRAHIAAALPDYMVPRQFVTLDAFPLTPNKKVDRNALPAPDKRQIEKPALAQHQPAHTGSLGDLTAAIAAIWSRILGVPDIQAKDSFFDLGGHSLLAVQAHREIRNELGVAKLAITDIFRAPTLEAFSAIVARKSSGQPNTAPQPQEAAAAPEAPIPATPQDAVPREASGNARLDAMARRREMRAKRQNR